MKNGMLVGGSLALAAVVALVGFSTEAASDRYKFIIRGIVTAVDTTNKTITLNVTSAPGKAFEDLSGKTVEFKASTATIYKRVGLKDNRVTIGNVVVGQELGVKGVAKNDDSYHITWLRIHDRSFEVIGLLKQHATGTKTITVLVNSSTFKSATYKGNEVDMVYTDDSKFYSNANTNSEVVFSDVPANDQRVKVVGKVVDTGTWEVSKLYNNYKGK